MKKWNVPRLAVIDINNNTKLESIGYGDDTFGFNLS
jgi:hypothetical protein